MDKLVIDIETKNSFDDVGGREYVKKLDASFVGVYSYNQNKYLSFFCAEGASASGGERQFADLEKLWKTAGLIIGFSINRFDIPVLEKYLNFDIWKIPRLDLLEEIEISLGNRVSLDILAKANLGIGKTHHGLEAIKFYKEQNWKELEAYCLHDVKITKELYELAKKQKHLTVPDRYTGQQIKVAMNWPEITFPQTLL